MTAGCFCIKWTLFELCWLLKLVAETDSSAYLSVCVDNFHTQWSPSASSQPVVPDNSMTLTVCTSCQSWTGVRGDGTGGGREGRLDGPWHSHHFSFPLVGWGNVNTCRLMCSVSLWWLLALHHWWSSVWLHPFSSIYLTACMHTKAAQGETFRLEMLTYRVWVVRLTRVVRVYYK